MQLFAQVDNQGTAMPETAVCHHHLASHGSHFATTRSHYEGDERINLADSTFHDCTGNDALSCNVCGAQSDSPDLIGKTITRVEFNADYIGTSTAQPTTTVYFTDGTAHTFKHEPIDA